MKELVIPANYINLRPPIGIEQKKRRWNRVLMVSLPLAVCVALTAVMMTAISQVLDNDQAIKQLSTVLTITVFPALIMTAHAIDKVSQADRVMRAAKLATGVELKDPLRIW